MGKKGSSELTLCVLLMAALCFEAVIIKRMISYPSMTRNWTKARLYCQEKHIDLVTWNTASSFRLFKGLMQHETQRFWIGLFGDPENESIWKWINRKWVTCLKLSSYWFQHIEISTGWIELLSSRCHSFFCFRTGEGISGDDVSQSIEWAYGPQRRHCAVVSDKGSKWHSERCSSENNFYCSSGDTVQYHHIALSWYNASHYCQSNSNDLATITKANRDRFNKRGWIGLRRKASETWSWIGDLPSDYRNWAKTEPLNIDCACFNAATKKCQITACSTKLHPVCHDDNLVVVNENKTWEEALSYCLGMTTLFRNTSEPSYNLLSLNLSDYNYVRDRIYRATTTDEVREWVAGLAHWQKKISVNTVFN